MLSEKCALNSKHRMWLKKSDTHVRNVGPEFIFLTTVYEPLVRVQTGRVKRHYTSTDESAWYNTQPVSPQHAEDRRHCRHSRVRRTYDQTGGRFDPATRPWRASFDGRQSPAAETIIVRRHRQARIVLCRHKRYAVVVFRAFQRTRHVPYTRLPFLITAPHDGRTVRDYCLLLLGRAAILR